MGGSAKMRNILLSKILCFPFAVWSMTTTTADKGVSLANLATGVGWTNPWWRLFE